jgi:hypothetical protein
MIQSANCQWRPKDSYSSDANGKAQAHTKRDTEDEYAPEKFAKQSTFSSLLSRADAFAGRHGRRIEGMDQPTGDS